MAGKAYFAYGSNLSVAQMASRCPGAKPLGRATLPGWRWLIMSRGYASITPDAGSAVEGLLWVITESDERRLDEYEGVAAGHYTKELVEVTKAAGGRLHAMVYVGADAVPGRPAQGYLERVIAAARERDFPAGWIAMLEGWLSRESA